MDTDFRSVEPRRSRNWCVTGALAGVIQKRESKGSADVFKTRVEFDESERERKYRKVEKGGGRKGIDMENVRTTKRGANLQ